MMKKKVFAVSIFSCILFATAFSQTEKFDIATFIPPKNWERIDSNGMVIFHDYKTNNNLTAFCQIILFPSRASGSNAAKNFEEEWNKRVTEPTGSKAKPTTQTEKTPEGWNVITGYASITQSGLAYTRMLVTATGFGKTMSVMVNTAGGDYASTLEKFFNDMDLDTSPVAGQQNNNSMSNQANITGAIHLNDYDFIAPQGWQVQKNKDHYLIQNMMSGCLIRIVEPQPTSGDLEQDAKTVFEMMYAGWQYQKTGAQRYTLTKGYLPKGLEYYMMEAGMSKLSADGSRYEGFEEGAALIIKAGAQIVIISARHNSSVIAHDDCRLKYETWRRFFNSFAVKNITTTTREEDVAKRIIGIWTNSGGTFVMDYVFAANGKYQYLSGVGTMQKTSDYNYEYIHTRASAFQGDGSYSINKGNQLILTKRGDRDAEQVRIRFEKVNHGGTGWKDRVYLLKRDENGKEYEVSYEKRDP